MSEKEVEGRKHRFRRNKLKPEKVESPVQTPEGKTTPRDKDKNQIRLNEHLIFATYHGRTNDVEKYLSRGADANSMSPRDPTTSALIMAASRNHPSIVLLLLKNGANPDHKNKKGSTALDIARKKNYAKCAKILTADRQLFAKLRTWRILNIWDVFIDHDMNLDQLLAASPKQLQDLIQDPVQYALLSKNLDAEKANAANESAIFRKCDSAPMPISAQKAPTPIERGKALPPVPGAKPLPAPQSKPLPKPQSKDGSRPSSEPVQRRRPALGVSMSGLTHAAEDIAKLKRQYEMPALPPASPDRAQTPPRVTVKQQLLPAPTQKQQAQLKGYVSFSAAAKGSPKKTTLQYCTGTVKLGTGSAPGPKAKQLPRPRAKTKPKVSDIEDIPLSAMDTYVTVSKSEPMTVSENYYSAELNLRGESSEHSSSGSESDSDSDSDSEDVAQNYKYREINYKEIALSQKIGAGAFGAVYKGRWRGSAVAVKQLHHFDITDRRMVREFRQEAALMQLATNHPNVINFVGACTQEEPFCLVTTFCEHGSLEDLLKKRKREPLPLPILVKMANQIAAGILHLHCEGVIHRDIAARNVLVGPDNTMFVTDFGFARVKESGAQYAQTKSTIGPVKYMAPEAIRERKYSEKSDVFSFGVLLWEMITCDEPYKDMDLLKVAMGVVVDGLRLKIPPSTHPGLKSLLNKCWEEDPDKRPSFPEIDEILAELSASIVA